MGVIAGVGIGLLTSLGLIATLVAALWLAVTCTLMVRRYIALHHEGDLAEARPRSVSLLHRFQTVVFLVAVVVPRHDVRVAALAISVIAGVLIIGTALMVPRFTHHDRH